MSRDPRIDDYIERSAGFAQPILRHLREIVHESCPEVEETMKWSFPHFVHHGILCSMASFKQHCAFGFWKGSLVLGEESRAEEAMGQYGRITSLDDLPPRATIAEHVRTAVRLNEEGVRPSRTAPKRGTKSDAVQVPDDLAAALADHPAARDHFARLSPSHRREYVQWITDAKRDQTRRNRIAQTVAWVAEGKPRNWKYVRDGKDRDPV